MGTASVFVLVGYPNPSISVIMNKTPLYSPICGVNQHPIGIGCYIKERGTFIFPTVVFLWKSPCKIVLRLIYRT